MKRITTIIAAGLLVFGLGTAQAQSESTSSSMSELLRLIEQGQARDSQEARQREADFARRKNEQQNLLNQARAERSRQERESERLEQLFENQQAQIVAARAALDERLGALKELFGVLQTVSGDTQGRFNNSLTNIQFPDRGVPRRTRRQDGRREHTRLDRRHRAPVVPPATGNHRVRHNFPLLSHGYAREW